MPHYAFSNLLPLCKCIYIKHEKMS
jgi:hypothetical protein